MPNKATWLKGHHDTIREKWFNNETTFQIAAALQIEATADGYAYRISRSDIILKLRDLRIDATTRIKAEPIELPPVKVGPQSLGKPVSRVPPPPRRPPQTQAAPRVPQKGGGALRFNPGVRNSSGN